MVGDTTLEDVLGYIGQISLDSELNQPFYEIVDFSEVGNLGFGYYESSRLMSEYAALGKKKGYQGTLFISGTSYGEAISKMFVTISDFNGINTRVVQTLEEAEILIEHLLDQTA